MCFKAGSERNADLQAGDQHSDFQRPLCCGCARLNEATYDEATYDDGVGFPGNHHSGSEKMSPLQLSISGKTEHPRQVGTPHPR